MIKETAICDMDFEVTHELKDPAGQPESHPATHSARNGNPPHGILHTSNLDRNHNTKTSRISFSINDPTRDDSASEGTEKQKGGVMLAKCTDFLMQFRKHILQSIYDNKRLLRNILFAIIVFLLNVYMVFALICTPEKASFLAPVFYFLLIFVLIRKYMHFNSGTCFVQYKSTEELQFQFEHSSVYRIMGNVKKIVLLILWVFILFVFIESCLEDINALIPATGLVFLVTACFLCSQKPQLVKISTILWGLAIQILAAYSIVRTKKGNAFFETMSQWARSFFGFSAYGSRFVFGSLYDAGILGEAVESYFVFAIHGLPLIIFLNSVVSVLYYLGIMQVMIKSIAYLLKITLGTSVPETLSAAANIFLGQVESPLIILPYLSKLSLSELHAVMCGGFATVAASVLGVYLGMEGLNPTHLVAASVLNAPASLVFAKIVLPEDPRDYHRSIEQVDFSQAKEKNVIEATSNGACSAIPICLNMCATIIAFLSILAFLNAALGFFGSLVNYADFNLEVLIGYMFYPAALLMGLRGNDAVLIAQLMGKKVIVNEWVAFNDLSNYVKAGIISEKAASVGIYAICNFANIGSLGIQLGGLGAIVSDRKSDLIKVSWSALVCGAVASISNACIIATLYQTQNNSMADVVFFNSSNTTLAPN